MNRRPTIQHSLANIAAHWHSRKASPIYQHTDFDLIGAGEPFCFRCGWLAPVNDTPLKANPWAVWNRASGYLERAHLADYAALRDTGRLAEDSIDNLVPLCRWCHRAMPEHDTREQAVAWVVSGPQRPWMRQVCSDLVSLRVRRRRDLAVVVDRVLARTFEVADG